MNRLSKLVILASVLCFSVTPFKVQNVQAQMEFVPLEKHAVVEHGVRAGSVIPHDLTGFDQNERPVNLSKLTGDNGIVLYVIRSADWSQHCTMQLIDIAQRGSIIEDVGYNIVILSKDSIGRLAQFTRRHHFPYPMISDPDSEILHHLDLVNTSFLPGTTYFGIPYPAIYIIGKDGFIIHKIFDIDFRKRPKVMEIRQLLDKLGPYTPVVKSFSDSEKSELN
jgi:peroxiredoxin Q/BCP